MDGMDWKILNDAYTFQKKGKWLRELRNDNTSTDFICDSIPHTACAWTSIFTGKQPEEHNVREFYTLKAGAEWKLAGNRPGAELITRDHITAPLLWEILSSWGKRVVVLDAYCTLPPLSWNTGFKLKYKDGYTWPYDKESIVKDNKVLRKEAIRVLKEEKPDVLVVTNLTYDKAHHMSPLELEPYYDMAECFMKDVIKASDDWIVISDHGHPCEDFLLPEYKIRIPAHNRKGVVMSNLKEIPVRHTVFLKFVCGNYFGLPDRMPTLDEKIEMSKKIIKGVREKPMMVSASFGKDSIVLLSLLREVYNNKIDFPVVYTETGDSFTEAHQYRDTMVDLWGLPLEIIGSKEPLSDDVEECCLVHKVFPLREYIDKNDIKTVFTGIRRDETPARYNELHVSPRVDHVRINPLLHWTEKDIWEYIDKNNIIMCGMYERGYRSIGCKRCTKKSTASEKERAGRKQDGVMKSLRDAGYF